MPGSWPPGSGCECRVPGTPRPLRRPRSMRHRIMSARPAVPPRLDPYATNTGHGYRLISDTPQSRTLGVGADLAKRSPHDVADKRPDQPPVAQKLSARVGIGCHCSAFVSKQRRRGTVAQDREVRRLAPARFVEATEVGGGDIAPLDSGLPESTEAPKAISRFSRWPRNIQPGSPISSPMTRLGMRGAVVPDNRAGKPRSHIDRSSSGE